MEYSINEKMIPADALKLAKRLRSKGPVSLHAHIDIHMPSGNEGMAYPWGTSIPLTMGMLTRILNDMQRFHDNKKAKGETASVTVKVSNAEPALPGMRPNYTFMWIG